VKAIARGPVEDIGKGFAKAKDSKDILQKGKSFWRRLTDSLMQWLLCAV
jgi:hypothetical protein